MNACARPASRWPASATDSEEQQAEFAAKHELPFLLLSDERRSAVERARRRDRRGRRERQRRAARSPWPSTATGSCGQSSTGGPRCAGRPGDPALSRADPGGRRGRLDHCPDRSRCAPCGCTRPARSCASSEVPMPEPDGTEVRVRVAGCGVCHTDLHIVDGIQPRVELPVTLGHEVAGWIDAIGPDRRRVRCGARLMGPGGRARRLGLRRVSRVPCRRGAALRVVGGARLPGRRRVRRGHARAPSAAPRAHCGTLDPVRGRAAGRRRHHALPRRPPRRPVAGTAWRRVLLIGCGALGQFARPVPAHRAGRRQRPDRRGQRAVVRSA